MIERKKFKMDKIFQIFLKLKLYNVKANLVNL